jgi:hypothetical protein
LNTVTSYGHVGGAALAAHLDVDKIAFTGSTATGRKIAEAAAKSNLKKVSLELGGKSPHIIFESADLEQGLRTSVLPRRADRRLQLRSGRPLASFTILGRIVLLVLGSMYKILCTINFYPF